MDIKTFDLLAERINRQLLQQEEVTAVITLELSGIVNLGFDRGTKLTPEYLQEALVENFINLLENSRAEDVIDKVSIVELRNE